MDKIEIVLIEDYPCEHIGQARGRECYWKHHYKTKQQNPQPIKLGYSIDNGKAWKDE